MSARKGAREEGSLVDSFHQVEEYTVITCMCMQCLQWHYETWPLFTMLQYKWNNYNKINLLFISHTCCLFQLVWVEATRQGPWWAPPHVNAEAHQNEQYPS